VAPAPFGPPALGAETFDADSSADLPSGLSAEQAEMARKLLQTDEGVRKAFEGAKQQKSESWQQRRKGGEPEFETSKKDLSREAEGARAGRKGELAGGKEFRYDWRKSPYVGSLFSKRLTDTERGSLTHFGHELFVPLPDAAQRVENIPVGPGYVVGPGDEIVVKMWGRVEGTHRMTVDRDGKIFFPKFGSLYVAGKTFAEMRSFLKSKVSTIAEVSSDVTLGQMKGIRVSVVGEVRAPGWYNASSFQTALQVLSIAGGIKDIGSLRRIKILRGGQEIQEIDLYDLLLAGDTRADIRLQQGDVIFVPVVARLAAIAGEVRRPAIYELRDEKSLLDLVRVAGGFAPSAWKHRVQVERLSGNVSRIILDASVEELENGKASVDLSDGDLVRVFPIVQTDLNVVTLEGNVHRPGRYEVKPGMTVGSLLKEEADFLPETYFDYGLLTRLVPPDLHREVIPVNLREIVLEKKAAADVALQGRDKLTVYNRSAFRDPPKATISGEVRHTRRKRKQPLPGESRFTSDEGLEPSMKKRERERERESQGESQVTTGSGEVRESRRKADQSLDGESRFTSDEGLEPSARGESLVAMGSDEVRQTRRKSEQSLNAESRLTSDERLEPSARGESRVTTGKVVLGMKTEKDFLLSKLAEESRIDNNVLTLEIQAGMRVADLVRMAGGLTRLAYLDRAEVVRVDENRAYRTIYFHLGKAVAGDPKENVLVENEDHVQIHSITETRYKRTVTASGDVNNPAEYVLTEGMRLSDLLFKAGGFKESAYAKEGELIRREVTPGGDLAKTETVVVYPDKALAGEPSADVPLREYDLLVVRQIPEWSEKIVVKLTGEVRFPGTYGVKKGERLSSLISRAGGFTRDAYLKAAQFSRASTQKSQQEAIDKLIDDLELEVAQKGQQVSGALDREDVEANRELLASRRGLIAQLKKTRAKGRIVIRLAESGKIEGTPGDVLLEDGDRLEVPKKMNVVNVVGRVYNPTGIVFDPARDTVGYYLRLVGGPTESADPEHIFLLKSDGSVVTRETAGSGFFVFGDRGLMSARVEPGDSILVPEKLIQTRFMKDVKDITQILYQIAVTAGVLIVAF
jgi:protein involved in polysaccharide export with SLBB domain